MLARYAKDMDAVMREIARVLRPAGRCVLVVGDCTMRGVFVRNSEVLKSLSGPYGLEAERVLARPLEANRRYLPPPTSKQAGSLLQGRMREEIVLTLVKRGSPLSPVVHSAGGRAPSLRLRRTSRSASRTLGDSPQAISGG